MLFLVVDDLRPKLGCYGESNMVTPNIDQLAAKSVRFDRAYVQVSHRSNVSRVPPLFCLFCLFVFWLVCWLVCLFVIVILVWFGK